ncbi:TPA: hypothetical protein QCY85_004967 [Bacillus cereus]|nr:hypothetical protein [Bacillus cereus]HDR8117383.1 hypothetical protein [Bacillus cereus]
MAYEEYKKRGFKNIYYMPFGIDYRFLNLDLLLKNMKQI